MRMPIQTLLQLPESKTLEFKRDLSSPRNLLKTLVAFANSAGGKLVVGVADDGQVLGVEDPLAEEERLCNLIADQIAPRLVPNVDLVTVDGKTLLVAEVFVSGTRPHFFKAEGIDAGVYVRLGSSNRQADAQLITELQRGVAGVSFDALPMPELTPEVLDMQAVAQDFAGKRPVDEAMLQSLRLLVKHQGRLVPSHGGVLLYGKDRRQYFDDAWVQCGRFMGTDKLDIFDHQDIEVPLPQAVDAIMLFLKKHAMRGADFSEFRRKDIWSIPIKMLREVVINALVHADYSHRGTPTRVAFFDDRIEVESPGLLMPGLTVEDMRLGVSQIRNPVIARVFRELELVEQWGSGIPGVFQQAKAENLPEPHIEELAGRVRFTVRLAEPLALLPEQSRRAGGGQKLGAGEQVNSQVGPQVSPQVGPQVSPQVKLALQACWVMPQSKVALLSVMGLSNDYKNFQRHLLPLMEQGLLEWTLPDKPNSRLQKYRLTSAGHAVLQKISGLDAKEVD